MYGNTTNNKYFDDKVYRGYAVFGITANYGYFDCKIDAGYGIAANSNYFANYWHSNHPYPHHLSPDHAS